VSTKKIRSLEKCWDKTSGITTAQLRYLKGLITVSLEPGSVGQLRSGKLELLPDLYYIAKVSSSKEEKFGLFAFFVLCVT
jgi:hypothetical protein